MGLRLGTLLRQFALVTIATVDPLSKLHNAIWDLFEGSPEFVAMFKPGNRIKFNSPTDTNPVKQTVATADTPEFAVVPQGITPNLFDTSSSTKVVARYQLIVNTGDWRVNEISNIANWIILCNLAKWRDTLTALTWKGKPYVKVVRVLDLQQGETDAQRNRGIRGWATVWQCEIEMHFRTLDLTIIE